VPALDVRGLTKRYGHSAAIEDVSFSVGDGELVCVVGPSGCGKTTLLRCVAGLLMPDSGRIAIGGRIAFSSSPRVAVRAEARGVGLVFQDYALWPHMSVRQHLRFPMESRGTPRAKRDEQVARLLELVQLSDYGDRRPGELSGGQQQRVALARALAGGPALMLMDEPMSNLDARLRLQMRRELTKLIRDSGVATLYVTHDQSEAMSIADRILVLRSGHVVQQGTPAEIYERPADLELAEFLGIGPVLGVLPAGEPEAVAVAGRTLVSALGFDVTDARYLIVPPSAVHLAGECQNTLEETVLPASMESASYEGGSWLVDARLEKTGELLQFRAVRPPIAGDPLNLHLVAGRTLPFTDAGLLCPKAEAEPAEFIRSEVHVP
jgi:ABC-type Fe3+/spermidine/putrescine transport system ATPase subunit